MGRTKKLRGQRTHGRGKKAGRGKGKRGGSGMAGLHKHKFKWMVKYDPDHFGAYGFKRPASLQREVRTINLERLQRSLDALAQEGFARRAGEGYEVDLGAAGYGKLLGRGRVDVPLTVTVPAASARAVEKVDEAGGQVILPSEEGKA